MWTLPKTAPELRLELATRIKARRLAMGWTQRDTAERASVSYRTWRRLESEGAASIEDLIKAAFALRCEEGIETLFPAPAASNLDELLRRQSTAPRRRAPTLKRKPPG